MSRLDALVYGFCLAAVVAVIATPLGWRLLDALSRARRAWAVNLAAVGVSGLAGLLWHHVFDLRDDVVAVAVTTSAALQGTALLALLLFLPKRP